MAAQTNLEGEPNEGSLSDDGEDDFYSLFSSTAKFEDFVKNREVNLLDDLGVKTSDEPECDFAETLNKKSKKSVLPPKPTQDENPPHPIRGTARGRGRGKSARATRASAATNTQWDKDIPPPVFVSKPLELNWTLDDSTKDDSIDLEDDNYEISVKVCWKSKTVTPFMIRKYQKLSSLFEYYAKQEGVPQSQLQLTLEDRIVSPEDTPDSLALTVANILEGGTITSTNSGTAGNIIEAAPDPDSIQLKIRAKDSKQPILIRIKKTQKMSVLMTKYSEKTEIPLEKLKFSFDGETIDPSDTPEDLDLEGDEMIDLVVFAT